MSSDSDDTVRDVLAFVDESTRLRSLSNLDLIRECLGLGVWDEPAVQELMSRVEPDWVKKVGIREEKLDEHT